MLTFILPIVQKGIKIFMLTMDIAGIEPTTVRLEARMLYPIEMNIHYYLYRYGSKE